MNVKQLIGVLILALLGLGAVYYATQEQVADAPTAAAPEPDGSGAGGVAVAPRGPTDADAVIRDIAGERRAAPPESPPRPDASAEAETAARAAAAAAEAAARDLAATAKRTAAEAERAADGAVGSAADLAEQAREDGEKALEQAGDAIESAADAATDAAGRAAESVEKAADKALEQVGDLLKSDDGAQAKPETAPEQMAALPPAVADKAEQPSAPMRPPPPTFDVAEVDADGDMTVAGRAPPGAIVRLLSATGEVLGEAIAGDDGAFVILPAAALPEGDSTLRLEVVGDDGGSGVAGAETIVVSRNGDGPPLIVLQTDDASLPSRVLQRPAPPVVAAADAPARMPTRGAGARTEARADPDPVRTRDADLAVGAVDYDDKGRLAVQGVAPPGASVTVDVDGEKVAGAEADAEGGWTATSPPGAVKGGRAERIGATATSPGRKPLRVSLPFAPADLIRDFPAGRIVVVQPGNSLWRIARRTYGAGLRYTVIYAANQDQIQDPDLIYPGQILHTPEAR